MEIEKTNRMNALFEFYAALLTDKQMNYIELYYADDYSLAEIAEAVSYTHLWAENGALLHDYKAGSMGPQASFDLLEKYGAEWLSLIHIFWTQNYI